MNLRRTALLIATMEGVQVGTPTPREPRTRPQRQEPTTPTPTPGSHYVRVELDDKSRQHLLKHFGPKFANAQGGHVTLSANPSSEELERYQRMHGQKVNFHATHHHHDDEMGVQAARVHGLDHLSDKPHKHITISTGSGVPALKSNELLQTTQGERIRVPNRDRRGRERLGHLPLTGTVEVAERLGRKS